MNARLRGSTATAQATTRSSATTSSRQRSTGESSARTPKSWRRQQASVSARRACASYGRTTSPRRSACSAGPSRCFPRARTGRSSSGNERSRSGSAIDPTRLMTLSRAQRVTRLRPDRRGFGPEWSASRRTSACPRATYRSTKRSRRWSGRWPICRRPETAAGSPGPRSRSDPSTGSRPATRSSQPLQNAQSSTMPPRGSPRADASQSRRRGCITALYRSLTRYSGAATSSSEARTEPPRRP